MTELEKCYFIENKDTKEWWAGNDENGIPVWTKDPMIAYPFDCQSAAEIRSWTYGLSIVAEVTEHIFFKMEDEKLNAKNCPRCENKLILVNQNELKCDTCMIYNIRGTWMRVSCDEYHKHTFACMIPIDKLNQTQ